MKKLLMFIFIFGCSEHFSLGSEFSKTKSALLGEEEQDPYNVTTKKLNAEQFSVNLTSDGDNNIIPAVDKENSILSGLNIYLPAGAIAIDTNLILEEGIDTATIHQAQKLNITQVTNIEKASDSISIFPINNITLLKPMTISLEILNNYSLGLAKLKEKDSKEKHLVVFYIYCDVEDRTSCKRGMIPTKKIKISSKKITFKMNNFGTFQAGYIDTKVQEPVERKETIIAVTKKEEKKLYLPKGEWKRIAVNLGENDNEVRITSSFNIAGGVKVCFLKYLFKNKNKEYKKSIPIKNFDETLLELDGSSDFRLTGHVSCEDEWGRLHISPKFSKKFKGIPPVLEKYIKKQVPNNNTRSYNKNDSINDTNSGGKKKP